MDKHDRFIGEIFVCEFEWLRRVLYRRSVFSFHDFHISYLSSKCSKLSLVYVALFKTSNPEAIF